VLRLRIDQRIRDDGIIASSETASGMRIALRKSRSVITGGQALNAVFVLNQETYRLLDQIPFKQGEYMESLNIVATLIVLSKPVIKFPPVSIYNKCSLGVKIPF
jgi:hypothetical protein